MHDDRDAHDARRRRIATLADAPFAPWIVKRLSLFIQDDIRHTEARTALVQQKAAGCLSVTGICVTLALAVGGPLLADRRWASHPIAFSLLVSSFVVGAIFGVISAAFALRAMKVRGDHGRYSFDAIFREEILTKYSAEGEGAAQKLDAYLLAHSWHVNEENFAADSDRLKDVNSAHAYFTGLLAMIATSTVVLALASLYQ